MYRLTKENKSVIRLLDNASIPFDTENTDYQAYQNWLNAGNTPTPADPPTLDEENAPVIAKLTEIDQKSIRALREYVAAKTDAPQVLKDREAEAQAERAKIKK